MSWTGLRERCSTLDLPLNLISLLPHLTLADKEASSTLNLRIHGPAPLTQARTRLDYARYGGCPRLAVRNPAGTEGRADGCDGPAGVTRSPPPRSREGPQDRPQCSPSARPGRLRIGSGRLTRGDTARHPVCQAAPQTPAVTATVIRPSAWRPRSPATTRLSAHSRVRTKPETPQSPLPTHSWAAAEFGAVRECDIVV
jgi:hypothetical protein